MENISSRIITFKEAVLEAQDICLAADKSVFLIGEGVPDPKAIFGTTAGLKKKYPNRVFDSPISENGVTGVCIGAAASGLRPILVHQRIDFSLYSADQIINVAAKIYSMYGGQLSCPLVIRMIVGRGWGQGNQHSQNLTNLYAQIPGLKIVVPSNAYDAKGLFISSVRDPNPVLFIEHRWLHDTTSSVPSGPYEIPLGRCRVSGSKNPDTTLVSSGHATAECKRAIGFLPESRVEHIDLLSVSPLDIAAIKNSVKQSGRIIIVDDGWGFGGLAAEIIAQICEDPEIKLRCAPVRITYPNFPSASSHFLTKNYYPSVSDIAKAIGSPHPDIIEYELSKTHDVPDKNFRGPF